MSSLPSVAHLSTGGIFSLVLTIGTLAMLSSLVLQIYVHFLVVLGSITAGHEIDWKQRNGKVISYLITLIPYISLVYLFAGLEFAGTWKGTFWYLLHRLGKAILWQLGISTGLAVACMLLYAVAASLRAQLRSPADESDNVEAAETGDSDAK